MLSRTGSSSCRALHLTRTSTWASLSSLTTGQPASGPSAPSNARTYMETRRESSGYTQRAPGRNGTARSPTRRSGPPGRGAEAAGGGPSDIPRYIRRERMQRENAKQQRTVTGDKDDHRIPLDPYILAKRLKKLCEENKIDDAVSMLKNVPRDAMNTPVWNSMMWEALKAQRFQLAYSLYIDMKRRGLSPSTRTYQTLFGGLSRIERWNTFPKQLQNARTLYEDFTRHIESLKKHEPYSPDITPTPLAGYIKILGNAGEYQEIFDVYYALDPTGTYAANEFVFTSMFQALSNIKHAMSGKGIVVPGSWGKKVASDTRMLWTQMQKGAQRNTAGLADAHAATAAISALSQGEKDDHELAFKIAHEFFGLSKDESTKTRGHFPLNRQSLGAILRLCNEAKDHSACMHIFQLVRRNERTVDVIDRLHVEEVLKARYQLAPSGLGSASVSYLKWMLSRERGSDNGPQVRPATSTYHLVLSACWKASDWPSAVTAFNLMTGFRVDEMADAAIEKGLVPSFDKREKGRNFWPSVEAVSSLVRTAVATKSRSNIRACFRLIDTVGLDELMPNKGKTELPESYEPSAARNAKNQRFYATKLAQAVEEGWEAIKGSAGECSQEEYLRFRKIKDRLCRDFIKKTGYTPTKLDE